MKTPIASIYEELKQDPDVRRYLVPNENWLAVNTILLVKVLRELQELKEDAKEVRSKPADVPKPRKPRES
jgi:hypothetical protein